MESDDVTIHELATDFDDKEMYSIDFYGANLIVTVTSSPAVVRNWIQSTWWIYRSYRHRFVVGLGVQWNPYSDEPADHKLALSSTPKDLRYSVADRYDEPELRGASMETLVSRFFGYDGLRKDPNVSMSNWNADWLTDEQVLYAAVDAYVSFQMGKVMF
ncbi:hypothetical protein AQUCO_00300495v1 [Aquilegia coerulea]|uniref:3'-5' exonuclease domain-containing protein n=1 Tax=Aquilegia coerulea TaxID=218851 RepID=A0A2G5EZ55_AQUCA|nr:hypothetical protein AQUCO_00300495v1 [Aquilegia coerulea]